MKIYSGTKMYRYLDGEEHPEVIRLLNIDYDKKIVKFLDPTGEKKKASYMSIMKDYKVLAPDGMIILNLVNMPNGNKDTVVALQPFPKTEEDKQKMDNVPYAVCRQLAVDVFSMMSQPDAMQIFIGLSVSKETCPNELDYNLMFACDSIEYSRTLAVYLDDTLDKILSLFDNKVYDDALLDNEKTYGQAPGYCRTLRQLLEENNFMFDFRRCFKIVEIPYKVTEEELKSNILGMMNAEHLAKDLHVVFKEVYVLEYSRELDISKIKRNYLLASSAEEKYENVYIVAYDVLRKTALPHGFKEI